VSLIYSYVVTAISPCNIIIMSSQQACQGTFHPQGI
jgi:hypothetical protein